MTFNKLLAFALIFGPSVAGANDFAVRVQSSSGLGFGPYGDPNAALGPPTQFVRDTVNGGPTQQLPASINYSAFGTSPSGQPLLVTVLSGGHISVEFDPPLVDQKRTIGGLDFIVFGNSFLGASGTMTHATSPTSLFITSGPDFVELGQVSVSPDGLVWYTYPVSAFQSADGYWPTQAFRINEANLTWGQPSNPHLPVPPTLTRGSLTGLSVAKAVLAYRGSAGGCAFDLAPSGFSQVRFVRVTGNGVELDAVSRVKPAKHDASGVDFNPKKRL